MLYDPTKIRQRNKEKKLNESSLTSGGVLGW